MNNRSRHLKFIGIWLALVVLGWLVYVLVRGLAAIIYLDVPFYDWPWYIPLIVLLIGTPVYVLSSRLRRDKLHVCRSAAVLGVLLLIWIIIGYNGFGQDTTLSLMDRAPISISFWAYSDFRQTPDAILKDIQAARGAIYLDAGTRPFETDGQSAFVAAMRRLADHDIPVYWAVPAPNFLSASVADRWAANVRRAAELVTRENLSAVRGFSGDVEPPLNEPFDWLGLQRNEFEAAINAYRTLQTDLHHDYPALQLGVTALWAHFLDPLDGDAALSLVMRSPLDPPGGWDFVNLMTYSSYYPESWRPYYVYVLERAMMRLYPTKPVSHLLGLVGGGMPGEPIMGFEELVRDARISRTLGVREIVVFQLDGALQTFGDDFVRRLNEAVNGEEAIGPVEIPFSRPISILFYGIAVADSLLDMFYSRAWLLVLWVGVSGLLTWRLLRRDSAAARHDGFTPPQLPTIAVAPPRSESRASSTSRRDRLPA
ncbi:MAG TPA: hypothetical protein VMP08_22360 [Anaerolineae bacterium]|nr:hypothetical protein [Anaerolineae bacterium]